MKTPKAKQAELQSAAADTYSKAGPEMKQAELPLAEAKINISKPPKAIPSDDEDRQ